jgi:transposase-like protein
MPWREVSLMDQRQELVRLLQQPGINRRELCRRFGISAKTAYKWLSRQRLRAGSLASTKVHRKNALGQPSCIFRLGRACSLPRNSRVICGAKELSQFSFMLLLVTSLMLTVCVGVAAWRMSDDLPEVTGTTSSESIHAR